jgi:hypothetical protein
MDWNGIHQVKLLTTELAHNAGQRQLFSLTKAGTNH